MSSQLDAQQLFIAVSNHVSEREQSPGQVFGRVYGWLRVQSWLHQSQQKSIQSVCQSVRV